MFTGIIEEQGRITAAIPTPDGSRLRIHAPHVTADAGHGDSIAVNGVCLTVVTLDPAAAGGEFTADVMPETLARTTLGNLTSGDEVNLERALRLADRVGGHLVQGHVDAIGEVLRREVGDNGEILTIRVPAALIPYVAPKGSITVDGVSLTVIAVNDRTFSVGLVPTTVELTTLGLRRPADRVNLETDMIAKHLAQYLETALPTLVDNRSSTS